jgi:hypothetical protein
MLDCLGHNPKQDRIRIEQDHRLKCLIALFIRLPSKRLHPSAREKLLNNLLCDYFELLKGINCADPFVNAVITAEDAVAICNVCWKHDLVY